MIKTKLIYFTIFGAILIFFFGANPTTVCAKTGLIVEGNVVGFESYKIRPFGTFALMTDINPVLFKVTKVLKGTEKSDYIKILTPNFNEVYAIKNFGFDKLSTFKLIRSIKCDEKLKNLIDPARKRAETYKTFTFTAVIEKNSLPSEKKIPCYIVFYETTN